jgi:hypothetical protein
LGTARYDESRLVDLFQAQKVCTMSQLKEALGTAVDMTVLRKLKGLEYRTSYSHRGAYYTLDRVARWDRQGLWFYTPAHFSRQGTLLKTVEHFVTTSENGYTAGELEAVLGVGVKGPLLNLLEDHRLKRDEAGALYVYYAANAEQAEVQKEGREALEAGALYPSSAGPRALAVEEIQAAVLLFWSLLDEQQRRLYAGLESMKLGAGGDGSLAELLEVDVGTIARGRKELLAGDILRDRVRRPGGGRVAVEKKRPA